MYLFFIRLRAKKIAKLANHADHQIQETHFLLHSLQAEMEPGDRRLIQERLVHAEDLRAGLDEPRLAQLRHARFFCDWAEETLRIIKEEMLPPAPQIET